MAATGWRKSPQRPILARMEETFPKFAPQMTKHGRWFVAVKTGAGPDSHVGDFETEAEAAQWIATKAKYWPSGSHAER